MGHFLWNMFANIKNGQKVRKFSIFVKNNKICFYVLNTLWDNGFILGFQVLKKNKNILEIFLKYKNGDPVIKSIIAVSKPGARIYCSLKQLWKINCNTGIVLVSTSNGLLTIEDCKKLSLGGEVVAIIK